MPLLGLGECKMKEVEMILYFYDDVPSDLRNRVLAGKLVCLGGGFILF